MPALYVGNSAAINVSSNFIIVPKFLLFLGKRSQHSDFRRIDLLRLTVCLWSYGWFSFPFISKWDAWVCPKATFYGSRSVISWRNSVYAGPQFISSLQHLRAGHYSTVLIRTTKKNTFRNVTYSAFHPQGDILCPAGVWKCYLKAWWGSSPFLTLPL